MHRLTGRPTVNQWPAAMSISRDSFPHRQQRLPRDLCQQLCEYSNDLLSVFIYYPLLTTIH